MLALSGCGQRGELAFYPEAAEIGSVQTILVSTARQATEGLPLYSAERAEAPAYARFRVSVPPDREFGTVTFPERAPPDPRTDFLVVDGQRLAGERAFVAAIDAELAADRTGDQAASLFVHGFNTNFAEALYRQAQLRHDLDRHGAAVMFSWPSAARTHLYLYDRESVLFSREALATTIRSLALSRARRVNLIGHSMGGRSC